MHSVFDAIARKHGFDETTISTRYLDILSSREKIGSSQRYGYLFENEKMWIAEPHVQCIWIAFQKHFQRSNKM